MVPGKSPNLQGELVRWRLQESRWFTSSPSPKAWEPRELIVYLLSKGGLAQDSGRASVSECESRKKADVTLWKQKEFIISYSEKDLPFCSVQTFNRLAEASYMREGSLLSSVYVLMLTHPETPPTDTVRMIFDQMSVHRMAQSSWYRKLTITAKLMNLVTCPSPCLGCGYHGARVLSSLNAWKVKRVIRAQRTW